MKKTLTIGIALVATLAGLFVTFVGPWPTYGASAVEDSSHYTDAVAAIDRSVLDSTLSDAPGQLHAGWAKASITPPEGTPLAGFGNRKGAPSTGVHDALWVKALALSDGSDTAVLVSSDMLIVPENVADAVRERVVAQGSLTANDILFNASHSHSGPGAFAPGLAARLFGGAYNPQITSFLIESFVTAISEATEALEPAEIAHGHVLVPELIRNRVRDAATDSTLHFLVAAQKDGDRCYAVRYSAHATVLGGSNMEFSADYPGFVQRAIERETGQFAMFLSGAVGSMGPKPPEGRDAITRAFAMGDALAEHVLEASAHLDFRDRLDVASVGIPLELPPLQLRLNRSWRLSPFLIGFLGVDGDGWLQGVRVGDMVLAGMPADFSGEISNDLRAWAVARGFELWTLSFNGDYAGYISPDRYYDTADKDGKESYEMYLMSWCGPDQEAFFCGLCKHMIDVLAPHAPEAL